MDLAKLIEFLQNIIAKKNIFLAVIVVLCFVMSAIILFGNLSSKIINLKNENQKKLQKISKITELNDAKVKLNEFISSLPKPLSGEELVTKVEDYAIQNHINILNVSSTDIQKHDHYVSMGINMSLKVQNFKDLISFFHGIEKSPLLLKIDNWTGRTGEPLGSIDCEISIIVTQLNI
jgi:hypothetical protein